MNRPRSRSRRRCSRSPRGGREGDRQRNSQHEGRRRRGGSPQQSRGSRHRQSSSGGNDALAAYGAAAAGFPMAFPGWPQQQVQGEEKKKKRRKKRDASSSSSSSSSSSDEDWRTKVWSQGWQGAMGGMWNPAMWGWPNAQMPGGGGPQPGFGLPPPPPPPGEDGDPYRMGNDFRDSHSGRPSRDYGEPKPNFDGWGDGSIDRAPPEPEEDVPIFLEPAIEEFVPVPKALIRKVIGKQAQTIIEIREKSGAFKVDARDQTSDPCQVKIAGTAEAVKKARALILEVVESTKNRHAGSDYVEIPRAKIGMVIGLKGSQVNEIQQQTGTKIDVDFEQDPCKCYIKGPQDAVDRAKKVLLTIAMQIEDENSEYVDLPKATSGAVIGAQGTRIREFQEQSGARIDVDKTGASCRVRLTGTNEQIANAKQLILAEVENSMPPMKTPSFNLAIQAPMVIPAHQPTSFPATLSESIARAKAAAEAVKNGLITATPGDTAPAFGAPSASPGGMPIQAGMGVIVPPRSAPGGGYQQWDQYRPW